MQQPMAISTVGLVVAVTESASFSIKNFTSTDKPKAPNHAKPDLCLWLNAGGLKSENIDSQRHLLILLNVKGKKDRIVPISDKMITMLRDYYKAYKPKVGYLKVRNPKSSIAKKVFKV